MNSHFTKTIYLFIIYSFFSTSLQAQVSGSRGVCGFDYLHNKMLEENPSLKKKYEQNLNQISSAFKLRGAKTLTTQTTLEIPIVVHILDDGTNKYIPTLTQINAWITRTNAILAGTASNIKGPGQGGTSMPIKLVLAKQGLNCTTTSGVVTHDLSNNSAYKDHGIAFMEDKGVSPYVLFNNHNWNSNLYYNIYISNKIDSKNSSSSGVYTYGFAYFPGFALDLSVMIYDIVINPNDTGFAHEIMHAFGLKHVFEGGDNNGQNCASVENDNITDTQRTRSGLHFGDSNNTYNQYKTYPTNSTINDCTNTPFDGVQYNIMNYGDYLDRFTPMQGEYALTTIQQMRPGLLNSLVSQVNLPSNSPTLASSCTVQDIIEYPNTLGYGYQIGIEKFSLANINSNTDTPRNGTPKAYFDFASLNCLTDKYTAYLKIDSTYSFSVGTSTEHPVQYDVYIDYNNNGIFENSEKIAAKNLPAGNYNTFSSVSGSFTVPKFAIKNTPLRLRIIADYPNNDFSPCANRRYGEVEDYTVIIDSNVQATAEFNIKLSNF